MGWVVSLLFSKVGAVLAGALGVLALWLRTSWLKRRAEKAEARARTAETQVEIQKVGADYAPKLEQVEAMGNTGDARRLAAFINKVWGGKAEPGQTGVAEAGGKGGGAPDQPEDR